MKQLLALLALLAGSVSAQTIVPVPAQKCTAVTTVTCQGTSITIPGAAAPPPVTCVAPQTLVNGVCTAPVVTPPPAGVTWLYYNGTNNIAGDFTQGGTTVDYKDTTGAPLSGQYDIYFTSSGPWGLFLPYFAPGSAAYVYPNPGWTQITLAIKPKVSGQSFAIYFERTGDTDPSCHLNIANYGGAPVAGKWTVYTVPLKDLCVLGDKTLYKMGIQDQSGKAASWWMDNIGFM